MNRRLIAGIAAVGLIAGMASIASLPAMADEPPDPTTGVTETTPPDTSTDQSTPTEPIETPADPPADTAALSTGEPTEPASTEQPGPDESGTTESKNDGTEPDPDAKKSTGGEPGEPGTEGTEGEGTEGDGTGTEGTEGEGTEGEGTEGEETDTEEPGTEETKAEETESLGFAPMGFSMFGAENERKVTLCHAKPADTAANGWNEIEVAKPAVTSAGHGYEHDADIIPAFDDFPGKNLATMFGDFTGQQILDSGCKTPKKEVRVPQEPDHENEYCVEGEAQDGSITVYYTGVENKIQYTIVYPDNSEYVVPVNAPTTNVPAGNYQVKAEGINGWTLKGDKKFWVKVKEADCSEVTLCHARLKDYPLLGWTELTVTESEALEHAKEHKADIIPPFGEFPGKNLGTYFFEFWTGQQILDNGCDKPWFYVDICHAKPGDTAKYGWQLETVGPIELAIHILKDDADIIPAVGDYPGKNLATDFGGITGQELLDNGCKKKVYVPGDPEWGHEYCEGGQVQDGFIWVDYTGVEDKLQYTIVYPDLTEYVVPTNAPTTYVPAGDYTIKVEGINGWKVKGDDGWPVNVTIFHGTCDVLCSVDQPQNEQISLFAVVLDEEDCVATAEVTITPATCSAAGTLQLGATQNAAFGSPTVLAGHYSVTATAEPGYHFVPDTGVSVDGSQKVFEGDLPPALANCGHTTLAVTGGGGDSGGLLWLAALAIIAGLVSVIHAARRGMRAAAAR